MVRKIAISILKYFKNIRKRTTALRKKASHLKEKAVKKLIMQKSVYRKILKKYFKEYANRPQSWVDERERVKKYIVQRIFEITEFMPVSGRVKIAVLGASDKRYIEVHRKIFREALQKNVQVTTFDTDTQHLAGERGIIYHDVATPFPSSQFNLVFSHSLLKFLNPEKQSLVIRNSYNALAKGGIAMHILHLPEIKGTKKLRKWQYRVYTNTLIAKLRKENIPCKEIELDIDGGTKVLVTQK